MEKMTRDTARTLAHDIFDTSHFESNRGYLTAKEDAQKNLMGKTHYVDPDTLRFHNSRVLSSYEVDCGSLFAILESCTIDPSDRSRGFRFVVFDLGGMVIGRASLGEAFPSKAQAENAMWKWLDAFDVAAHYKERLDDHLRKTIRKAESIKTLIKEMGSE